MKTCKCGCGVEIPSHRAFAFAHQPGTRGRHTSFVENRRRVVGVCDTCKSDLVTMSDWRRLTPEERRGVYRYGRLLPTPLCDRHFKALKSAAKSERLGSTRAKQIPAEEILSEWELLRSDGVTDLYEAARRIGTTKNALEKCLERARKRGDRRGDRFHHDQLGGPREGRTGISRSTRGRAAA